MRIKKKLLVSARLVIAFFSIFVFMVLGVFGLNLIKNKSSKGVNIGALYENTQQRFSVDLILVVLNYKESILNLDKIYMPEDFPEFEFNQVKDLTVGNDVNNPSFRKILALYLTNPSKENVLEAIKRVQLRSDVQSAEVNLVISIM
ncbi:MAG: hypothetical protein LBU60_01555 [Clostridiales bacterium]|jgi:hypothetical protein|nr:hypothetical protein [Clostridiales bacterium]